MALKELKFAGHDMDSDCVIIHAWDDNQLVLGFVSREALEDHLERSSLTKEQRGLLVDWNIELLGRIMSKKYAQGDFAPYSRTGSTLPRVDILNYDLRLSGEKLTDSVLDTEIMWAKA